MNIFPANEQNILKASELIRNGELVAFPTETVYGLGADAMNPIAVAKIFEIKKRPSFNPLIVHISDKKYLFEISNFRSDIVEKLVEQFWPGPLTLVLPKKDIIPNIVTAGNDTVAVRMPNHKVALELISSTKTSIAAPSANIFGRLSPTSAE
ncbi:MAG: threonylcarbamoyl-AMP synthase, partial [Ignavibacteriales bacterium]|nr:threonylcarbamoyl-AMP synthase [Ignavibacteriales bacterium]